MLPQPLIDLLLVIGGYLAGSLPMGVIVARLTGARDPRTVGSGRTGGTNALRAMGFRRALAVGLLDIAKGAVPVLVATLLGASPLVRALAGGAAILGAWRSVFLRFHGGRGVATGIGALLVVQPLVVLLDAPVFFGTIWLTRFVSLGSLLAAGGVVLLLGGFVFAGLNAPGDLLFGVLAAALVLVAHSDNIARLRRGEERRFEWSAHERQQPPPAEPLDGAPVD
ncbi:MAG TPA: glycerol-3-phosphate 1-O-acyltransferase PlsY [Candidatus Caenarcaniphilales bacterium]|nr:glycerol-3-phosphate 1-O-acyltransferase PlsY [Candidatus Caenarcaniphilales bacterium]